MSQSQSAPSPPAPQPPRAAAADDEADRDEGDESMEGKEEEVVGEAKQDPLLAVAQDLFLLSSPSSGLGESERRELLRSLQARAEADDMTGLVEYLNARRDAAVEGNGWAFLQSLGWGVEAATLSAMRERNAAALKAADAKIEEAREVAGDTEVREALWARAQLHARWGAREQAHREFADVLAQTVGVSSKLDVLVAKLRLSLAFLDTNDSQADPNLKQFRQDLDKAKTLLESGGDWERKNQLNVYEALYLMVTRNFADASKLLLDSVSTFTATDLFDYRTFVLHACALAVVHVDRAALQKDVLKSPEILSVIDELPGLRHLLTSLYRCNYREFFTALDTLLPLLHRSRYLAPHLKFYLRELRVVAYSQFLASYKSARLSAMADAFGVSQEFLDAELFKFIGAGRLHAKIDKVEGRVDTNRPDKRNQIYHQLVKNGDGLLNRLHKLSKIVAL